MLKCNRVSFKSKVKLLSRVREQQPPKFMHEMKCLQSMCYYTHVSVNFQLKISISVPKALVKLFVFILEIIMNSVKMLESKGYIFEGCGRLLSRIREW